MPITELRLQPVMPGQLLSLGDEAARVAGFDSAAKDIKRETKRQLKRLEQLQAAFQADSSRSFLLVLQGRDAAGKDGTIRAVMGACNPMGVRVAAFGPPNTRELGHDYLWRVHKALPSRGVMGVFNRSHYEDVLVVRVRNLAPPEVWEKRFRHMVEFERMLTDSGTVIVKCFIHVSRDEQRARLQSRLDDPAKNWKFRLGDLEDRAHWDDFTQAYRDVLARTSTEFAPWYVVPSDNKDVRNLLVARLLVDSLEQLNPQYPLMDPIVAEAAKGFA